MTTATKRKTKATTPPPPEPVMLPLAEAMEKFKAEFTDAIGKRFAASEKAVAEFRESASLGVTYAMEWRGKDALYAERLFQTNAYAAWKKHGAGLLTAYATEADLRKNIDFQVRWKLSEILEGNHDSRRSTCSISNLSDSYRLPAEQEQLKIYAFTLKALKTWDSLTAKLTAGETAVSEDDCRLPSWYGLFERYEDDKPAEGVNAELVAALEAAKLRLESLDDAGIGCAPGGGDIGQSREYKQVVAALAKAK